MSMSLMVQAMKARVGNPLRKLVLIKLADNASDTGECWPAVATIAYECEISTRSVQTHIRELVKAGFVRVEERRDSTGVNKSNIYHLSFKSEGENPAPYKNKMRKQGEGAAPYGADVAGGEGEGNAPPGANGAGGEGAGAAPRISQLLEPVKEPLFLSQDSDEPHDEKTKRFLERQPEARTGIYTPGGKSWGNSDDLRAATWIYQRVAMVDASAKEPNWAEWANVIRLMRVQDGRTHKEICSLFKWANANDFWSVNILSPRSLRKHWQTLSARRQQEPRPSSSTPSGSWNNTDWIDPILSEVEEIFRQQARQV